MRRLSIFGMVVGAIIAYSACGQGLVDPPFQKDDLQLDSYQMRYSSRGLGKMGEMMASQMPQDPQAQEIPPQCDISLGLVSVDVCGTGSAQDCTPEDPPCSLGTKIESFTLDTQDDNILLRFDTTLWTDNPLTIHAPYTDCYVYIDTTLGDHPYVPVTIPISMTIDPVSDRTVYTVGDVQVDSGAIDDEDIRIEGDTLCLAVEYLFEGMLVDAVSSMMADQIGQQMQASLCRPCDYGCPHDATCSEDTGLCMEDSGGGCVSNFGGEASMPLMGYGSPALEAHHWAGGYEGTELHGLSMGFDAAYRSSFRDGCTPVTDPPAQTFTLFSPTVANDESPFGGDYDAAMVLTVPYLTSLGFALYESGTLCWDLGSSGGYSFDTSTLTSMLPSLQQVTHGHVEPMAMMFIPQQPPVFTFGEGQWHMDGDKVVVDSPHILMTEPNMAVDFYVWIDGAKVRVVRYLVNLDMPIVLIPEDGQIHMVSGGLLMSNIRVEDSDMLAESDVTLIGLMNFLASNFQNQPFDMGTMPLPQMMGFNFVVKDGGIIPVDDASYLAVYMDMEAATPVPDGTDSTDASQDSVPWPLVLLLGFLFLGPGRGHRGFAGRNLLILLIFFVVIAGLSGCSYRSNGFKGDDCGGVEPPMVCKDPAPECVPGQKLVALEEVRWGLGCRPLPVECTCAPDSSPLEPGEVTWNPAIATDGSRVLVVAREEEYGDLVYAWAEPDATPQWNVLDGAPDGPVIAPPDSYRGGVEEPGPDDGYATAAEYIGGTYYVSHATSKGVVRLSWRVRKGEWRSVTVSDATDVKVLYTAIGAYDPEKGGMPRVAWTVLEPGKRGVLYLARATASDPQGPADFVVTEMATTDTTDMGTVGLPPIPGIHVRGAGRGFLAYDNASRQLVYYDPTRTGPIYITPTGSGEGMFFDACPTQDGGLDIYYLATKAVMKRSMDVQGHLSDPEVVDDGIRDDGRHVVGNFLSVVCDPLVVMYQDGSERSIVRLRKVNGVWARKVYPHKVGGDGFDLDVVHASGRLFWLNRAIVKEVRYWRLFIESEELR